jgi:hypothetical protein
VASDSPTARHPAELEHGQVVGRERALDHQAGAVGEHPSRVLPERPIVVAQRVPVSSSLRTTAPYPWFRYPHTIVSDVATGE